MKRERSLFLMEWIRSKSRKPLVIRGARQVGKTWLIRDFANVMQKNLVELNFEKRPNLISLFSSNEPKELLVNISSAIGRKIDPLNSILFLDEIQAAPQLFEKLRWFAEDMRELAVVVAGSLLDFSLAKHEFSMPVGRISYMYLEPLSFEEFLDALGKHELKEYLQNYEFTMNIPDILHVQLIKILKEYLVVGGMPAAVSAWASENEPETINQIQYDLLSTYRDDFAKYSGRLTTDRLEDIINSVPRQLGKKFVYKNANSDVSINSLKQALDLLIMAKICHRIVATSANGLPLGAEADEKFSKIIALDCGLCSVSLGLALHKLSSISEISLINNGGMAEQFVGQQLRTVTPAFISPSLYYWQREKKGSEAEVDYVIQHENQIIPIEVKAGVTGKLKSLHQFMKEKNKKLAVRVNSDVPKLSSVQVKDASQAPIEYDLLSIPFYLLGQIHRMIKNFREL